MRVRAQFHSMIADAGPTSYYFGYPPSAAGGGAAGVPAGADVVGASALAVEFVAGGRLICVRRVPGVFG